MQSSIPKTWYIVTNYPRHPSPYFSELDSANEGGTVKFRFLPTLPSLHSEVGIINLHRLKRLYMKEGQESRFTSALQFCLKLTLLKMKGFKVVWTLHNLYPIDSPEILIWDRLITELVFILSDTVICHTNSDALAIGKKKRVRCPVVVSGWGSITGKSLTGVPRKLEELIQRMKDCDNAYLIFGNIVPYKEVRRLASLFIESTTNSTLFVVGPSKNLMIIKSLLNLSSKSGKNKIYCWNERVHPSFAHLLFSESSVAICHYKSSGRYSYFREVLFPSSVATAVSMGIPIVAPRLPSVLEIANYHPAMFYDQSDESIRTTLQKSESVFWKKKGQRADLHMQASKKWEEVCDTYYKVYKYLDESTPFHKS